MSSFTAPLELRPAPPALWATTRPFGFWTGEVGAGLLIEVEAGYLTDLGTIPPVLWPLLPRDDPRWAAAFVLHDKLCTMLGMPRLVAAAIFLEALLVLARVHKVPLRERWRIWAMAAGVTLWALIKPYPDATPSGSDGRASPPTP